MRGLLDVLLFDALLLLELSQHLVEVLRGLLSRGGSSLLFFCHALHAKQLFRLLYLRLLFTGVVIVYKLLYVGVITARHYGCESI